MNLPLRFNAALQMSQMNLERKYYNRLISRLEERICAKNYCTCAQDYARPNAVRVILAQGMPFGIPGNRIKCCHPMRWSVESHRVLVVVSSLSAASSASSFWWVPSLRQLGCYCYWPSTPEHLALDLCSRRLTR